jgi:hypothetical protein
MLAAIADGESVVDSITALRKKYRTPASRRTLTAIRHALVKRSRRIDRQAKLERVLPRTARVLRAQQTRLRLLTLDGHGMRAVAPGLERSYRRARQSMERTTIEPSADNYHRWRRRVKDLWLQLRLIERRCANRLRQYQCGLEALDGCLGEYHNVVLLERALMNESLVSRQAAARCLHLLRRYQRELRRRGLAVGPGLFAEAPGRFARRIRTLWRSAKFSPAEEQPWRRAA